ncbi:hypothetical protein GYN07_17585 [Rhizobium leguminosarum bv. viciae 248]|nr:MULTISPECIES: hypothetical protein [Rhizobium]MBY3224500.1 hypothetical protein [Rhizobium laguerreae]MBY3233580.1 hypothetical protein [Rhizobium laguerreae]MBY3467347.1 hypothetical protein [Rhizobium laguerreae]MCA2409204.1 hypothetical protein [Rhizobium leguminosarum]MDU0310915.1 hypothetical protein [Rhizobium sp. 10PS4]
MDQTRFQPSTSNVPLSMSLAFAVAWVKTLRPFFVGWNNAAQRKKFLPFRNFFIKAALTAH